ncbi:hypothetical protein C8R44DRAFT_886598 [Mycena epipterygia]|nr:hypothetical protein C8R44DRAFT_886598 [Mycena epipterygia]
MAQDLTLTGRGEKGGRVGGDIAGLHNFIPNRDVRWRHLDWDTSTTMVPCSSQLCLIEMRGGPLALGALLGSLTMVCNPRDVADDLSCRPTLSTKSTTLPLYSNAMQTRSRRATAAPASPAAPDPPPGRRTRSSKPTPPTPLVPSTTRKPSKKGKKALLQENPEEDLADEEPKKKKQKKTPPPLEKPQIEAPAQELPQDDNTSQTVVEAAAAQDLDLSQEEEQDENALQTVVKAAAAQDLDLSQEEEQDENALQTVVQVAAAQDLDLPRTRTRGMLRLCTQDRKTDEDIVNAEDAASPVPRGAANTFANLRGGAGPFANSLRLVDLRELKLRKEGVRTTAPKVSRADVEFANSKGYSVMQGHLSPNANVSPSPSPGTSPHVSPSALRLRPRKRGGHATRPDEDDDDGEASDTSSYSNTAAKQAKEDARHNGFAGTLMPVIVSEQQQDEEDFEEYITETARGKAKGKGKGKQTEESGEEDEDEGQGGAADDDDDEEDMGAAEDDDDDDSAGASHQPWDLRPGALSDIDLKAAQAARQAYHDALEVIA